MSVDGLHRRRNQKTGRDISGLSFSSSTKTKANHPSVSSPVSSALRSRPRASESVNMSKVKKSNSKNVRRSSSASSPSGSANRPAKNLKAPDLLFKSDDNDSVRAFFDEIKDSNPTDLTDLSDEEPKKKRSKTKSSKKSKNGDSSQKAKNHKKKHIVRKIVILLILAIIISGASFALIHANDLISKVTDGGNIWNVITADPLKPLKKDENNRTNVLIFGTEGYDMNNPEYDGGYLTDSMMLVSFDQDTGKMQAVSVPRDLKVPTCTATNKINELFWCEYMNTDNTPENNKKYEELGGNSLESAFENILGLEIHYRIHLNWKALEDAVNALGGIDVVFVYGDQTWDGPETTIKTTSKRGLADGPRGNYTIQYPNGEVVHLNGWGALSVARARNADGGYGAAGGNFSREIFQQRIIEAMAKKAKEMNFDLTKILKLKEVVGDNLRTNFQDTEIKTLLRLAQELDISTLESLSLVEPGDGTPALLTTSTINGISYVIPTQGVGQYSRIHQFIQDKVAKPVVPEEESANSNGGNANPSQQSSTAKENPNITVLNAAGKNGLAAKEKSMLEGKGFTVGSAANAPDALKGSEGVRIFQRNDKMPKSAEKLLSIYKGAKIEAIPSSLASFSGDFIIVLGSGI